MPSSPLIAAGGQSHGQSGPAEDAFAARLRALRDQAELDGNDADADAATRTLRAHLAALRSEGAAPVVDLQAARRRRGRS